MAQPQGSRQVHEGLQGTCPHGSQSTHEEAKEKREVQALGHASAPTFILIGNTVSVGVLDVPLDVGGVRKQPCGV